jgi:rhomboid protease GluP
MADSVCVGKTMTTLIPARSKGQAMDWCLVLISQGIESTIDHSENGWGLVIPEDEKERAVDIIEQYRVENRHWPWRQKFRQRILFDWASVGWVFLVSVFFWLESHKPELRAAGLMDAVAVSQGQWWRLFTPIFLHADIAHLAANGSLGLLMLGLAMGRYGTGIGLLAAYLAGVGGNLATWVTFQNHHSLGASGMVMGCVGLLAIPSVSIARNHPRTFKYIVSGVAGAGLLFVLVGLNPRSDVLAHAGGFFAGALLGGLLTAFPRVVQNTRANVFAGTLFCLLVILTWWLAL